MAGLPAQLRVLGQQDYAPVWRAMQRFTDAREEYTVDEIWVVEHAPDRPVAPARSNASTLLARMWRSVRQRKGSDA